IIVDTAPSGHLLRLLELPEIALSWIRALLKLMLSYKEVVHWGDVAREIVSLSRRIKHTMSLLTDSSKTEFVAVAIPEEMSLQETVRLYTQLLKLNVPINRLLINNVVSLKDGRRCAFCRTRRQEQDCVIGSYLERFSRLRIFVAPQQVRPVQGLPGLRAHFSTWARYDAI